ncbi:hypothetical protein [Arthrospiribacter ruber]|uniref:Uncharacterized protein n=1 Tax=Arthrospiribacter ruber TaxID=2487934 RepID=A0A951MAZ9_9BACT|nr:hypothetical protein [Arthrospiribacter ruber]MBW3468341.1 hypothetical protein [Arthrospiribacter ruber]
MNILLNYILFFTVIINPILEGRWVIERFITFEIVINSKNFQNLDAEQQIRGLEMYNLYLEGVDLNFTGDTVYFKDLKNEKIINKIGLWYIDKDTLIINDLEVMATYKYYIETLSECNLHLIPVLPRGLVGKGGSTFIKDTCS